MCNIFLGQKYKIFPVIISQLFLSSLNSLCLNRVHKLFLFDSGLKKAKFSFGHFISHKNSETGRHDMKVRKFNDIFVAAFLFS